MRVTGKFTVENRSGAPFYIMLSACVLIVLGDLRNVIGPLGYWLIWGAVTCAGAGYIFNKLTLTFKSRNFKFLSIGFLFLSVGGFLTSILLDDVYTAYQGLKLLSIFVIFVVLFSCSNSLSEKDIYLISRVVVVISLLVFVSSKLIFIEYYVIFPEDGRQGSMFAFPGVLWKTSAFFATFVLANMITDKGNRYIDGVLLIAALYLLTSDGSRTGAIWFLIACLTLLMTSLNVGDVRKKIALLDFIKAIIAGLVLASVLIFMAVDNSHSLLDRLLAGDPVRSKMLVDGVASAIECFPSGCGFGSTVSFNVFVNKPMVVHNAYLQSLGDLGGLGLLGVTCLSVTPVFVYLKNRSLRNQHPQNHFFVISALLGVLGFAFLQMLHPLSTEMSEWGIWLVMVSWLSTLLKSRVSTPDINADVVRG